MCKAGIDQAEILNCHERAVFHMLCAIAGTDQKMVGASEPYILQRQRERANSSATGAHRHYTLALETKMIFLLPCT